MQNKLLRNVVLGGTALAALFSGVACSSKTDQTTTRDYEIVGEDGEGGQFLVVVTAEFGGLFGAPALLDAAVDNNNRTKVDGSLYPTLLGSLRKELARVNVVYDPESPDAAKSAIQTEAQQIMTQFNGQRVGYGVKSITVGRYIDYHTACLINMEKFLENQEEGIYGKKATCSPTDSDGDFNITATVLDKVATEKFGRPIQAVFQVPIRNSKGGAKYDAAATAAQFPNNEGLADAFRNGAGAGNTELELRPQL